MQVVCIVAAKGGIDWARPVGHLEQWVGSSDVTAPCRPGCFARMQHQELTHLALSLHQIARSAAQLCNRQLIAFDYTV